LSDGWNINVWYLNQKFVKVITHYDNKYHGASCYSSLYNAVKAIAGKYKYAHFIEYDVGFKSNSLDEHLDNVNQTRLNNKKLAAFAYKDDGRSIHTCVFSFDVDWLNSLLVPINTWNDYTETSMDISSKCNVNDDYILEYWFYNYIQAYGNIDEMEILPDMQIRNIVDQGEYEPGIKICLSDTDDGKVVLFVINIRSDSTEHFEIKYNDEIIETDDLYPSDIYYKVFDKTGNLEIINNEDITTIDLIPNKKYTDTRFKFYDDSIKGHAWNDSDSIGFIEDVKLEEIIYTFNNYTKVEILGKNDSKYRVEFIDTDMDIMVHTGNIEANNWTRANRQYYTNWKIKVYRDEVLIDEHILNLEGKKVKISLDSKSLGDTIAWFPYAEEFRKKHKCKLYVSTFWNNLFKDNYTDISFVDPDSPIPGLYASYTVGCRDNDYNFNKNNWRLIPLQQVSADSLGLEYKEIRPRIVTPINNKKKRKEKYIAISEFSTVKSKEWNYPSGWQTVIDDLSTKNIKTMVISKEPTKLKYIIDRTNCTINQTINHILNAEIFIGVSSGPTWLAWALNVPTILISGFSKEWAEMESCYRIINKDVCNGCYNNLEYKFDRGDWNWCPAYKIGKAKQFECTTNILPSIVINTIDMAMVKGSK
jgi:autotransporter strand-loop-strand O-heptosyltransferase